MPVITVMRKKYIYENIALKISLVPRGYSYRMFVLKSMRRRKAVG